MRRSFEHFLIHGPRLAKTPSLGRSFAVTRETWSLADDPRRVRPTVQILVTRKTASEAADFARMAAEACPEHGFHKPSGAWWGSDGERFHRFATRGRPPSAALIVLGGSAALGVAAALLGRKRRK